MENGKTNCTFQSYVYFVIYIFAGQKIVKTWVLRNLEVLSDKRTSGLIKETA
jgi:hypothetical protein